MRASHQRGLFDRPERAIIKALQQAHPARIRLFVSTRNQNDNEVFTRALAAARGEYIAILDGDDYWTDPLKLQKQVRFMDQNPDIFICGHAVRQIDAGGDVLSASKFDITTICI